MEMVMNKAVIALGVGLVLMVATDAQLPATDADEQAIR